MKYSIGIILLILTGCVNKTSSEDFPKVILDPNPTSEMAQQLREMTKELEAIKIKQTKTWVLTTFLLALLFVYFQFKGFGDIIAKGYYFTGAESSITTSFLYVLVLLHLAHLFVGMIVLTVVYVRLLRGSYSGSNTLGFELAHLFWHFLDFLWIYLYLFVVLYS